MQHKEQLTLGQRAADRMRNIMGSWAFVYSFLLFMVLWGCINVVFLVHPFDPYPFVFLNLFLSMLAGLQGAILLIAAKRQDEISAALAQNDLKTNIEAERRIEELQRDIARMESQKLDALLRFHGIPLPVDNLGITPAQPVEEGG